jgi:hypothetical protein
VPVSVVSASTAGGVGVGRSVRGRTGVVGALFASCCSGERLVYCCFGTPPELLSDGLPTTGDGVFDGLLTIENGDATTSSGASAPYTFSVVLVDRTTSVSERARSNSIGAAAGSGASLPYNFSRPATFAGGDASISGASWPYTFSAPPLPVKSRGEAVRGDNGGRDDDDNELPLKTLMASSPELLED